MMKSSEEVISDTEAQALLVGGQAGDADGNGASATPAVASQMMVGRASTAAAAANGIINSQQQQQQQQQQHLGDVLNGGGTVEVAGHATSLHHRPTQHADPSLQQKHNGIVILSAPAAPKGYKRQQQERQQRLCCITLVVVCLFMLIMANRTTEKVEFTNIEDMDTQEAVAHNSDNILSSGPSSSSASEDKSPAGKVATSSPEKARFFVVGERHSNVEWWITTLEACFPSSTVQSGFDPNRPSPFFQERPDEINQTSDFVILSFLNPYDYVEQMRLRPLYAESHWNVKEKQPMEWKDFVTKTWTTRRPHADTEIKERKEAKCQYGFPYKSIVPCTKSPSAYEMTLNGRKPYQSILDLRSAKIKNYFNSVAWFNKYNKYVYRPSEHASRPDAMAQRPKLILKDLGKKVPLKCDLDKLAPLPVHRRQGMSMGFVEYINEHLDWSTEEMIEYTKWSKSFAQKLLPDDSESASKEEEDSESESEEAKASKSESESEEEEDSKNESASKEEEDSESESEEAKASESKEAEEEEESVESEESKSEESESESESEEV